MLVRLAFLPRPVEWSCYGTPNPSSDAALSLSVCCKCADDSIHQSVRLLQRSSIWGFAFIHHSVPNTCGLQCPWASFSIMVHSCVCGRPPCTVSDVCWEWTLPCSLDPRPYPLSHYYCTTVTWRVGSGNEAGWRASLGAPPCVYQPVCAACVIGGAACVRVSSLPPCTAQRRTS